MAAVRVRSQRPPFRTGFPGCKPAALPKGSAMNTKSVRVSYPELAEISSARLFREAPRDENLDRLARLTSIVLKSPVVLFCLRAGSQSCIRGDFGVPESWTSGNDLA